MNLFLPKLHPLQTSCLKAEGKSPTESGTMPQTISYVINNQNRINTVGVIDMTFNDDFNFQQIPCPGGTLYTVLAGDTIYSLAQQNNTTVQAILTANPGINPNNLQLGQVLCLPIPRPPLCPGGFIYRIQSGDTFYGLANRYGLPVQEIMAANPGVDPNNLQIGQEICIPGRPASPERPRVLPLVPRSPGPAPNAGGVLWLMQDGLGQVEIVIAITGVPHPTPLGANRYTAVFTWGRSSYELPLLPVPGLPGLWVGRHSQTFPAEFFTGGVDIYPGPVLGGLLENSR
jgi:LysM repeat protein